MRDGDAFRTTIRYGAKAVQSDLVVHLSDASTPTDTTSVGFVVSKTVGNAVVRNRVKRRLRHAVVAPLSDLSTGHRLVIRALATSADSTYSQLEQEIAAGLGKAHEKLRR